MRDYAELVKAWRYCAVSKTCDGCPMQKNCPEISHQIVAADAIEELLAAVPHWISVEERLPEQGERVLVSNGGFICESYLSQSGKWQRGGVDMFFMTPTHWTEMPRFEPPKEESK